MPNPANTIAIVLVIAFSSGVFAHDVHVRHQGSNAQTTGGDTFEAQMGSAMKLMDLGMAVTPSGDPDRDFAAMMIPHHQGAVDMARVQLQFGKDPVLRRLAQAIIVEQLQEIDVMQRQLNQLSSASGNATSRPNHSNNDKEH